MHGVCKIPGKIKIGRWEAYSSVPFLVRNVFTQTSTWFYRNSATLHGRVCNKTNDACKVAHGP